MKPLTQFLLKLLLWLPAMLSAGLCLAQAPVASVDLRHDQAQILNRYFEVVEDAKANWTLADLRAPTLARRFRQASMNDNGLNFGYNRSAWWLRIKLRNDSGRTVERVLEIGEAALGSVQFYQAMPDGSFAVTDTGSLRPFSSRVYPNRQFVFPLSLPPHSEQEHYLRIQSQHALLISAKLWRPETFHHAERIEYSLQAGYFGMVCAMVLFNLLLFFALGDSIYLSYVVFAMTFAVSMSLRNGLAIEFLPARMASWITPMLSPTISLSVCALLQFMRSMLNMATLFPRLDRLCLTMIVMEASLGISFFFIFDVVIHINTHIHLAVILTIFAISITCARHRIRSAHYFLAAFSALLLGGILVSLRVLDLIPSNDFTAHALQFGSALEMLLLAFALADRLNLILKEKEDAQIEALSAQQSVLDNLRAAEALLEQRVAERSLALAESNQSLAQANEELNSAYTHSETLRQAAEQARQHTDQVSRDLHRAQEQLIQAEKMAALGQLIYRVAQEIDGPISTIKKEGQDLSQALHLALQELPGVLRSLNPEQQLKVLELTQQKEPGLPTMLAEHADAILPMLAYARTIGVSTKRINLATERVNTIIKSLKNFARFDGKLDQIDLQAEIDSLLGHLESGTTKQHN